MIQRDELPDGFCLGAELLVCRPTLTKLDQYFPKATLDQQRNAGYHAEGRPGLPSFLTGDCTAHLRWCQEGENPYGLSPEELARRQQTTQSIQRNQEAQAERFHLEVWGWGIVLVLALVLLVQGIREGRR